MHTSRTILKIGTPGPAFEGEKKNNFDMIILDEKQVSVAENHVYSKKTPEAHKLCGLI